MRGLVLVLAALAPSAGVARAAPATAVPVAAVPASAGEIQVSFAADHLVLDGSSELEVRFALPAGAALLSIATNVGRLGSARAIGDGGHAATYSPPAESYPQVALVAAVGSRGGRMIAGWAALPLWGKGEAVVRAQPGARAAVTIEGREFGPVVADARGVALVPVVVPPGVKRGMSAGRPVDLHLPSMRRLLAVLAPSSVPGVSPQAVHVWVFSVDERGTLSSIPRPAVSAFGIRPGLRTVGPGAFGATLEVPAGLPARLSVQVTLEGDGPRESAELGLERTVGPPARIELEPLCPVGRAPLPVRVRLVDLLGTPVDGRVDGRADAGELGGFVRRGPGVYEALWRPPQGLGARVARLRLSVVGQPLARQVEVALEDLGERRPPRRWFWMTAAASGALLASGLAMRLVALSQSDEYQDPRTSLERRRELKDSGERLTTASGVVLGLGAAAAVGTAVLGYFTFRAERPRAASFALAPLPGGVLLSLRGDAW